MSIGDAINVMKASLPGNLIVRGAIRLLCLLSAVNAAAQLDTAMTPEIESLAGSVAGRPGDANMVVVNPGAAAYSAAPSLQLSSTPSPLGIPGLVESAIVAAMRLSDHQRAAIALSTYGESRYVEGTLSISFATFLTADFSAGTTVHGHLIATSGYPPITTASADLGALARIGDRLRLGVSISNLLRPVAGGHALPQSLRVGIAADLDSATIISADLLQTPGREPSVSVGLSHVPSESWMVRGGFATEPVVLAGGFGVAIGSMCVELAASWSVGIGMRETGGVVVRW